MSRHGVVGHAHAARDLAGRQAVRLVLHQEADRLKSGRLGERRKGEDGLIHVHMSRLALLWHFCLAVSARSILQ